jgi:hypothetical protein
MDIVLIHKADLEEVIRDAVQRGAEMVIRKMPRDRPAQYTISGAAALDVSRPTVYRLIAAGNICLNAAGRISAEEIDRIISSRKAS